MVELANPVFAALDMDDPQKMVEIAGQLQGRVGGFKLGPRHTTLYGAKLVEDIAQYGPVFVDNKYYDIPNTMEAAVRATFEAGASFCTVHSQSGSEALQRMAQVERELNQQRPFQILSVTILTSFNSKTLPPTQVQSPIEEQVEALAKLSLNCGLSGIVCSPFEVSRLCRSWPQGFFVTPGVRLGEITGDDQKRVMTPAQALSEGASALVIGRPIVQAKDPVAAALQIVESL